MKGRVAVAEAPGSVGNLICGFDLLGLCLEGPADRVAARLGREPGVRITSITGDDGRLPLASTSNSAGVAAAALLEAVGEGDAAGGHGRFQGVELELEKGLPVSGGLGGSAASAVAAVLAVDALLDLGATPDILYRAALAGERMISGSEHGDNVAPSLFGGIVLARPGRPVLPLPFPAGLAVALLHPALESATREGRALLPASVPMSDAVEQAGHTAALVSALYAGDWALLGDALHDRLAEPYRKDRIPGFDAVREAARGSGALGCGISGAGPSMVAVCRSRTEASAAGSAMQAAFARAAGLPSTLHISGVGRGARILEAAPGTGEAGS